MRRVIYSTKKVEATDAYLDDNADLYVVKIWYEVEANAEDTYGPEAAEEIIFVKAISPQQAIEYAKMQWSGPIDRIEIVDVNPEEYPEDELYASTAIKSSGHSYASKQDVEDRKRAKKYTYSVYPDYDQDRLDALLDINWNDVVAADCEGFLIDLVNFPDLGAIDSVRYVTDDELNDVIYAQGYDGGFFVRFANGDYSFYAWKNNDNNLYPIGFADEEVEGCSKPVMSARKIEQETSFKEWLAMYYGDDFDPSGLSDQEFFYLEDQYREDVPREYRERNYR